ncbi:prtrc system protein e [Galbibacter sp. EGI 63066]|uniref:prtrc system protein e n=1 Tax=Galbibacter sp. EGI 63066 TaxID=2993559 RepID=UPI002249645E|nr:prtrc system protein e [Galbibacter sp. EGI 63066]MCX2681002.1 prtrc system protein e [Galbibacter sp. EGI 63066]
METNFFSQIANLNITGDLQLTLSKAAEGNFVVSLLLRNDQCGDDARKLIPPLSLKGSIEELDKGFFENITAPLKTTSGLMLNMEAYLKQVEEARRQSEMEKEKARKEKEEKEKKDKKYKEALKKADELEKEGRYKEAWSKMPSPDNYPEYAEAIRKRKKELSDQFSPNLFDR